MEDQSSTLASTIVVTITPQGINSPVIHTDTEEEQIRMQGLLAQIAPCLDVADAIVKKADLGVTG